MRPLSARWSRCSVGSEGVSRHSLTVKVGYGRPAPVPSLELDDILWAARSQRADERVKALRSGRIYLTADARGEDVLGSARADKWLEANMSVDTRRFFLMDGEWFEMGADYVRASRDAITPLFAAVSSVTLLPWSLSKRRAENDYNRYVAARSGGRFLCLDRNQTVRDPLGIRSRPEICDLLGPENELIHVKRAKGPRTTQPLVLAGPQLGTEPDRRAGPGTRAVHRVCRLGAPRPTPAV